MGDDGSDVADLAIVVYGEVDNVVMAVAGECHEAGNDVKMGRIGIAAVTVR